MSERLLPSRVVDYVSAGFPERLAGLDGPRRLPLELEQHFAFHHVTERRPPGVAVRGRSGIAGRPLDHHGHHFGVHRQKRRGDALNHGQHVLQTRLKLLLFRH